MTLTCGVGYNSGGEYKTKEYGKRLRSYQTWKDMLKRCYDPKVQLRNITYIGCTVHPDWHDYQVFAEWCTNHEYRLDGYQLDKDLLIPNNRVYSPNTCCFVPNELNSLLTNCGNARGKYPQGVCWDDKHNSYRSQINMNGKYRYLGLFKSISEASLAYRSAKESYVKERANVWRDRIAPEVYDALMAWELS